MLQQFFEEQFATLRAFMASERERVHAVYVDPDLREMLFKALARIQDERDFPHALIALDASFEGRESYLAALGARLCEDVDRQRARLAAAHVVLPASGHAGASCEELLSFAESLAEALPDSCGSLVIVLAPDRVDHVEGYAETLAWLARSVRSRWLKFLVIEPRQEARLSPSLHDDDRFGAQTFYLPPEEIEHRARADLAGGSLTQAERRRHLAVVAGFAFAKKDYSDALKYQTEWAMLAENDAEPAELANALYNKANSHEALGDRDEAELCLTRAGQICLEHAIHSLLALVLTNLGVVLHRAGREAQALQSLEAARATFQALGNRPGEAHACCCIAALHADAERPEPAELSWSDALACYASISSDALQDVRESGRRQVLDQLTNHLRETGRRDRLDALLRRSETGG